MYMHGVLCTPYSVCKAVRAALPLIDIAQDPLDSWFEQGIVSGALGHRRRHAMNPPWFLQPGCRVSPG